MLMKQSECGARKEKDRHADKPHIEKEIYIMCIAERRKHMKREID